MKIIYGTDFHGEHFKFEKILEIAKDEHADVVINGGDMLGSFHKHLADLHAYQQEFLITFLIDHFKHYEQAGIHWVGLLGNDDLIIFDELFQQICSKFTYVHNIAQAQTTIDDITFVGMNYVVDYPFSPKERCRLDDAQYIPEPQAKEAWISSETGWQKIDNWLETIRQFPTLEEELNVLPKPDDLSKAIYVIHHPPAEKGLDLLKIHKQIGSYAVYKFLHSFQPMMSLHGHVHESPGVTEIWENTIGDTICIQPGQQNDGLIYVIIDLDTMERKRIVLGSA